MKQYYWYSRSRSSSSAPREQAAAPPVVPPLRMERTAPAADANPGCMAMVHYLIFAPGAGCVGRPANSHDLVGLSSSPPHSKGLEAPRNSLELDGEQLRDIQIGVQIEPAFDALARSAMRPKATAPSSEAETPRTPGLVARLMGIDGLPEQSSPSPALKKAARPKNRHEDQPSTVVKEKKKRVIPESMNKELRQPLRSLSCNVPGEARSLPDTPRPSTSSSARASWDHPRLSLQVLKENVLDRAVQYMSLPTSPTSCGANNNNKNQRRRRREAAKEQAREIVRQAKETVTNRKSSGKKSTSDKENVISPSFLEDKLVVVVQGAAAAAGKPAASPPKAQAGQRPHDPRLPPAPKPPPPPPPRAVRPPAVKFKKQDGCERFATRIKKPATTTSHQLDPPAPPPAAAPMSSSAERRNDCSTTSASSRPALPLEEDPEYSYLRTALERGGFMRTAPSRPLKGQSAAAPVDPIVFHLLELELPADEARLGPLRHRWNRKLLFHLAQEILADLLLGPDAAAPSRAASSGGPALLGKVWSRVRGFPAADCKLVGDIDALVARDLEAARHPAAVGPAEAVGVADEVAERVMDALLGEYCAEESRCLSPPPPPPAAGRRHVRA